MRGGEDIHEDVNDTFFSLVFFSSLFSLPLSLSSSFLPPRVHLHHNKTFLLLMLLRKRFVSNRRLKWLRDSNSFLLWTRQKRFDDNFFLFTDDFRGN